MRPSVIFRLISVVFFSVFCFVQRIDAADSNEQLLTQPADSNISAQEVQTSVSAEEAAADTSTEAADINAQSFPYVAEITGTDVLIRSGPGTNYYRCGKLDKPARVTVVAQDFDWSKILPPPGSFSWISKDYVKLDPNDPEIGVLTGDDVRVWTGSPYVEPMYSSSLQTKLNTGDIVEVLGEDKSGYYKIAPPENAFLWVSFQYTKYLGPVGQVETAAEAGTEPGAYAVTEGTAEAEKLQEYHRWADQIKAEKQKPVAVQDYGEIKEALTAIADDLNSGKAGRYAKAQLGRIEYFEFAKQVAQEVERQDALLEEIRQKIRTQTEDRLKKIPDLGRFAIMGELRPSQIYNAETAPRRYLVVDELGKIKCYAEPVAVMAATDLSTFMGRRVGLVGMIQTEPQSGTPLIRFTDVVELEPATR